MAWFSEHRLLASSLDKLSLHEVLYYRFSTPFHKSTVWFKKLTCSILTRHRIFINWLGPQSQS